MSYRNTHHQYGVGPPPLWWPFYAPEDLLARISFPVAFAIGVVSVSAVASFAATRLDLRRFWDLIVSLTPAILIHLLDRVLNRPMFPGVAPPRLPRTHAEKSERMHAVITALGVPRAVATMRPVVQSLSRAAPSSTFLRPAASFLSGAGRAAAAKGQPPGLGNLDNSCYQNSILQGLASLDHLAPYLESSVVNSTDADEVRAARTLGGLMAKLRDKEQNGRVLWTPGVLKNMSSWVQQDAQEYFSKLLDEVDSGIAKATSQTTQDMVVDWVDLTKDDSSEGSEDSGYHSATTMGSKISAAKAPRNPLEGLLAQRVTCGNCKYTDGISLIPFNCLTLSLGLNTMEHDLYERMDAYTTVERIEGVQCPRCTLLKLQRLLGVLRTRAPPEHADKIATRLAAVEEALEDEEFGDATMKDKCGVTTQSTVIGEKTKQVAVARPPKSLVVHMNRSVFDERTGLMFKNMAAVRFPTLLDLGPWCLGSAKGTTAAAVADGNGVDVERWATDPDLSMVAGSKGPALVSGPVYELRAVVTHYGNHHNGHYICYRKHCPARSGYGKEAKSADDKAIRDAASTDAAAEPPEAEDVEDPTGDATASKEESDGDTAAWWRISDDTVYKVDEEFVLQQGGVFMLFYDCVEPVPVLMSDLEEVPTKEAPTAAPAVAPTTAASAPLPHGSVLQSEKSREGSPAPEFVPLPDDDDDDLDEFESVFDEEREETPMTVVESPAAGSMLDGEEDVTMPTDATKQSVAPASEPDTNEGQGTPTGDLEMDAIADVSDKVVADIGTSPLEPAEDPPNGEAASSVDSVERGLLGEHETPQLVVIPPPEDVIISEQSQIPAAAEPADEDQQSVPADARKDQEAQGVDRINTASDNVVRMDSGAVLGGPRAKRREEPATKE